MSSSFRKITVLSGPDYSAIPEGELRDMFFTEFGKGMHGICYSAYEEGQKPGDILTIEQIRRRMAIIAPHTQWIRSFSCIEGNELIPQVAREFGLKTLVGAWLGKDKDLNRQEIDGLIQLAQAGFVDIAAVGNEVMYRGDLTEAELLEHIASVKSALPDIPVGYVDAYYEFSERPELTAACDVILANCYPFWEACPIEHSLVYMKQMYQQAVAAGGGKKVIITETGWPSQGSDLRGALPSEANALRYYINAMQWTRRENIELFYFTSFDESWKVGSEGDVGAYWGLWDMNGKIKH